MGYYADLIKGKKEKINAVAKLVKKTPKFDIYEDFEGYFMTVKDGKVIKGGYLSVEDAERDGHRATQIGNEKENSILSTEMYKGYKIEVYKAKVGVDYGFNIYDKSGALFDWGTYFDSERDALRWAKLAIDRKANSKEESYYAKLAEEKASKKNAEEKRIFKVMGEEFDISTVGGMKKAAEAIEYHFQRKRDELGLPTAEQWKAKIGHELLLKARER